MQLKSKDIHHCLENLKDLKYCFILVPEKSSVLVSAGIEFIFFPVAAVFWI